MKPHTLLAIAFLAGCGDKVDCEVDTYQCTDGEMLQVCDADAGWIDDQDCAEADLMCHAEMGHCMDMEE
jgi:hypothetical protein